MIGSPGARAPYTLLVAKFEKATGHKVTTAWGGVTAVAKRVADGDGAILIPLGWERDSADYALAAARPDRFGVR